MKKIAAALLLYACAIAAPIHQKKPKELVEMEQLTRMAAANLQGDFRMVFALDEPLVVNHAFTRLPTWMVTVERFPANDPKRETQYLGVVFVSPPPCAAPDSCTIREIHGEVVFRGRFVLGFNGRLASFSGSQESTKSKVGKLSLQLREHPEWTKADLAAALASAGAKFGPDTEKEFRATLPWKALENIFGPLRVEKIDQIGPGHYWAGYWRVRMVLLREPSARLRILFEPFEGQLQELGVLRPIKTWDSKAKKYVSILPSE